jgi:hypothetical protein
MCRYSFASQSQLRASNKEKTVALLRRQRFLFGGLGRNRTIDPAPNQRPQFNRQICISIQNYDMLNLTIEQKSQ